MPRNNMLSFLFSVSVPSTLLVILTFFILNTTAVFAFPSLTSEPHRRSPVLAVMATFSPLAVTGFSFLAIGLSCALLRLFFILKPRLLASASPTTLPQPVSASRTSALSFRSPFSLLRYRQKTTTAKTTRSRSRWFPLSAFYRRFTRPSSPLHLSEPDVLPIAMPDSTSTIHSLLDLSVMPSSITAVKDHGPTFQTRHIARSSSMDTLPSYRPLTPVPILVPVARHIPSPPATPSPTTPKSFSGVGDTDIPLVPITPSKPKSIPQTTTNECGLSTPPPTGHFPAISLSPFKPNNSTFGQLGTTVAGTRPTSPTHSRFLTSRTLSSLSLSPRSLSLQQSKRSKGLGGVTVKRISPPPFDLDQQESGLEPALDVANCLTNTGSMAVEPKEEVIKKSTKSVSLAATPPSFLLDLSSPPSSPASDYSSTLDILSSSPSASNSDMSAASAPLTASRTTSQSSNSSDLAKSGPISLVDVDINVDADASEVPGLEVDWRVPEWSFDVEEPGDPELVLADFDSPSSVEDISGSPVKLTRNEIEKELIEFDNEDTTSTEEQKRVGGRIREWDGAPDDQGSWEVEAHAEAGIPLVGRVLEDEEAMSEDLREGRDMIDPVVLSSILALAKELVDDTETETDIKYPDPDLLPLPETINVLPSIFTEANKMPVISSCTQPAVLRRNRSNDDSDASSGSSLLGSTSPISLVQTPTPPASPPRETRVPSLPKPIMDSLDNDRLAPATTILPMSKCIGPTDTKPIKDHFWTSSVPLVRTETSSSPMGGTLVLAEVSNGIGDNSHFFEDERFFYSPECITQELDNDDEFTVNVEAASDHDSADDSHYDDEVDILPSRIEVDDDYVESAGGEEVVLHCPEGRLPIGQAKSFDSQAGEEKAVADTLQGKRALAVVNVAEILSTSEMDTHPSDITPSYAEHKVQEKVAPASVPTLPSEHSPTPVPGTFPDANLSLKAETISETQSLSPKLSVPLHSHRRRRSPLEEAIASTRSPLEVALAMQLRPGLGLGADPAWMVRFMMVMWGWMFGLVLVPTAEA